MKSMQGLLHKTSLQAAQEQQQKPFAPRSVAGQKRPLPNNDDFVKPQLVTAHPTSHSTVHFQTALSLPLIPSRLSASKIIHLAGNRRVTTTEYSQRRLMAATPLSSQDPELDLAHSTYGLPSQIVSNFASLGINHIYPWQKNCLKGPGLLTGEKNLVYCAPTGGGKSLVADCEPIFSRCGICFT